MSSQGIRLDVWLWRARFFKTRALSARHISGGRIRIARDNQVFRVRKPHSEVHIGDQLTFIVGDKLCHIEVLAMGERRGPAVEAQTLYIYISDTLPPATSVPLTV